MDEPCFENVLFTSEPENSRFFGRVNVRVSKIFGSTDTTTTKDRREVRRFLIHALQQHKHSKLPLFSSEKPLHFH